MSRRPRWSTGDRAWWPHRERGETVYSAGRVVALDDGPRPGVRLRFDEPVRGGLECYATHDELLTEQQARRRGARIVPPPQPGSATWLDIGGDAAAETESGET